MVSETATDHRIQNLAEEVDRLRKGRSTSDGHLQRLILKVTEVQLNLATQDKTLGKLESAVNGNGRPGLISRCDRLDRVATNLIKIVWLLTAAVVAAAVKFVADHLR